MSEGRRSERATVEPKLGRTLDLMRVLWSVDHGLQSMSKRMQRSLGVTGPQRLVVRLLERFPGMAAGRLAEPLHLHPSTLTGVLERLARGGLVERRADPDDKRRTLVTLTGRGRELNQARGDTVESRLKRVLNRFPAEQVAGAQALLMAIAEELRAEG